MTEIRAADPRPVLSAETRSASKSATKSSDSDPRPELPAPLAKSSDPLARAARIVETHLKTVTGIEKRLTMEKNEAAGVVVYKAIDRDTGEVIKQFPPEDLLKLLAYYRRIEGLALDAKA